MSGAGKSILALHLAICVSTGRPWLGIQTRTGKVAYWDEDNPDMSLTENRIAALSAGMGLSVADLPPSFVFRACGPVIGHDAEINALRQRLIDSGVTLLIVDTLASVNPWDESGVMFSRAITRGCFPFIHSGICVVVLHHIGKAVIDQKGAKHQRSGIDAARGHSSLIASVGAAFNLMRDGNKRYLECVKPRYGRVEDIPIEYDENSANGLPDWSITLKSKQAKLSRENLAHLIMTHGWQNLSSYQIVENVKHMGFFTSQRTAARALK